MQEMIDNIHHQDPAEVQRQKHSEIERDNQTRNNSSFIQKDWREDRSGDGVTPWKSRLTKARNTVEHTTNVAPLLEGIQGSTIMIHEVQPSGKGLKATP